MKHLFLNKKLSLLAKEKGFDEKCIGYYWSKEGNETHHLCPSKNHNSLPTRISSPLYQQIIDWFREEHDIHIIIRPGFGTTTWYDWRIISRETEDIFAGQDESYEKIEDCYNKAIEASFKLI